MANGRPKMRDTVQMDASTALWSSKVDSDDSPLDVVFSGSIMSMSMSKVEDIRAQLNLQWSIGCIYLRSFMIIKITSSKGHLFKVTQHVLI